MLEVLLVTGLLALHLSGLACLALAQNKHWQSLQSQSPRAPWAAPIGWSALTLSLLLAWAYQGAAFGSLIWLLLLPPSGYVLALTLAWRPQWLRPLVRVLGR
nr:DUF3325 family protein [uncultured Pseudomonas sp.]